MYINPIIAFMIAFMYFDEPYHVNQLLAYGLLVIAIVVFNWGVIKDLFSAKNSVLPE